ncbi:PilW family protein [Desulfonatronum lacustre]|uniref:PilW family protein n=1 Tax=Desulfonatronum lacustre TaxID=66849 RepID=UPI00048EAC90|nr:hypothetical protein [Desulfonatronum lacustre]
MARKIMNSNGDGFTIVELIIAMLAMMVLIGALVLVFISQSRMSVSEEEMLSLQMNLRVATERLSHAFSHAGFGGYDSFQDGFSMTGNEPGAGNITINTFVSNIENGESISTTLDPDSLVIVYGFKKIGTVDSITDNVVQLKSGSGYPAPSPLPDQDVNLFKRYFYFFPNYEGNVFSVLDPSANVADGGRKLTFLRNVDAPEEATMYMVSPSRIQIVETAKTNRIGKTITIPTLYLKNFAYTSAQYWIVAENIEDLQVQYSTDGEKWLDDPVNLLDIRKIRFWVVGRSENQTGVQSQVFEVTDLTKNIGEPVDMCIEQYTEDGDSHCVMYRVGPFSDGYARMLSRGEVVLRNVF